MPRIQKEKPVIKRKFYTDQEMIDFEKQISPFLVNGKLGKETMDNFHKANKICKFYIKTSPISKKTFTEMSIYENRIDDFYEAERKLDQWLYWKNRKTSDSLGF